MIIKSVLRNTHFCPAIILCSLLLVLSYPMGVNGQNKQNNSTPKIIQLSDEMLRVNPLKLSQIEYSTNGGRTWFVRYQGSSAGDFVDLLVYKSELLAVTTKGIYYSTNSGRSWFVRYQSNYCGTFYNLTDNGTELLAQTSKGLYYSTNNGRSWFLRRAY